MNTHDGKNISKGKKIKNGEEKNACKKIRTLVEILCPDQQKINRKALVAVVT